MVECGSLENCLAGIPRYEGSNPSLSAISWSNAVPVTSSEVPGSRSFSDVASGTLLFREVGETNADIC